MLYISTGDATDPNPPDKYDTGQDLSDLLSSILRIDVDKTDPGMNYAISERQPVRGPAENARRKLGLPAFRNPWRMSFDRADRRFSGSADVGWELYEMVYRVQKRRQLRLVPSRKALKDVRPDAKRGPHRRSCRRQSCFRTPRRRPSPAGFVYHGKKFPELEGAYLCGRLGEPKKCGLRGFDKDKIVSQ